MDNSIVSTGLQSLEALLGLTRSPGATSTGSTFSTGQTLPTGNTSTAASASPPASTPASQFASDVLSYLTGLQDVAGTAATVALGSSPLGIAAGIGIQGVLSLAGDVAKSLKHGG